MGNVKSFLLGVGVSFGVYYLTKKRPGGTSILDDILNNPQGFVEKAKDYAIEEGIRRVKKAVD